MPSAPQLVPHAPQCRASMSVSTHSPPQVVLGNGQVAMQPTPPSGNRVQNGVALSHGRLHSPQSVGVTMARQPMVMLPQNLKSSLSHSTSQRDISQVATVFL
jgi:hypothetical protein